MTATSAPDDVRVDLMAIGVPIAVEVTGCNARLFAETIRQSWQRCLIDPVDLPGSPVRASVRVVVDEDQARVEEQIQAGAVGSVDPAQVMHDLSPRVTMQALSVRALEDLLLLHAAGLADASGWTVALIGPSGTGKTTAVRRLGPRFGYVSDETVAIARDHSIVPYPKPLSVLDRDDGLKTQHAPDALGMGATPAAPRLACLVELARDPATDGVEVERVDTLEALVSIAPQAAFFGARSQPLRTLAALLEDTGGLRRIRYAEAENLEPTLRELMAMAAPVVEVRGAPGIAPVVEVRGAPATSLETTTASVEDEDAAAPVVEVRADGATPVVEVRAKRASKPPTEPTYRLGSTVLDWYLHRDGRGAVYVDEQILVLTEPAMALVAQIGTAEEPLSAVDLAAHAAGADLPPVHDPVAGLLDQLVALHVIETVR